MNLYILGKSSDMHSNFHDVKSKCKSIQCNLKKHYTFLLILSFCLILSDNCASRKKKAQLWLIFICWIFYIRFVDTSSLLIVPSHSKYYASYNSSKQHQLSWSSPLDVFKQITRKKSKVLKQVAQLEPKQLILKAKICASAIKPFFKKSKKER